MRKQVRNWIIRCACAGTILVPLSAFARPQFHYTDKQYDAIAEDAVLAILRNIEYAETQLHAAPGAIPPSTGSAYDPVKKENQNYKEFTWVRDAAEAAETLVDVYTTTTDPQLKALIRRRLFEWVNFNLNLPPNTLAGRSEPKYYNNGTAFNEDWGRPQHDGPAHRAITAAKFAEALLKERDIAAATDIYQKLVVPDLNHVSNVYSQESVDMWEETWKTERIKGYHFATLRVQQQAVEAGTKLAAKLSLQSPESWRTSARAIENWLPQFIDRNENAIVATRAANGDQIQNGRSALDALVYMYVLGAYDESRFTPSNPWVIATADKFRHQFEVNFAVNQQNGTSYAGRYLDDHYFGGNVWAICTFALSDFYYEVAVDQFRKGRLHANDQDIASVENRLAQGDKILNDMLTLAGVRIDESTGKLTAPLNISEQYSREDGRAVALPNLTWNYAVLFHAIQSRKHLQSILRRLKSAAKDSPGDNSRECAAILRETAKKTAGAAP